MSKKLQKLQQLNKATLVQLTKEYNKDSTASQKEKKDDLVSSILEREDEIAQLYKERYPLPVDVLIPLLPINYAYESVSYIKQHKCDLIVKLSALSGDSLIKVASLLGYSMQLRGEYCAINDINIQNPRGLTLYMLALLPVNIGKASAVLIDGKEAIKYGDYLEQHPIPIKEAVINVRNFQILRCHLIRELESLTLQVLVQVAKKLGYKIRERYDFIIVNGEKVNDKRVLILIMIN
jgi:hypothetical protein